MQILIIAGGDGTRMRPLVTHKSLWEFRDTPLIEYILQDLTIFQAHKTIIVASPLAAQESKIIADRHHALITTQAQPLGMADAIISAKGLLDPDDSTLVVDGCTLRSPESYLVMSQAIEKHKNNILLPGMKIDSYKPGGYFDFRGKQIVGIIEKPGGANMPSPYFKQVMDYYPDTRKLLSTWEQAVSDQDDVYEVALTTLIKQELAQMVELTGYHASLKHAPRVIDVMENILKVRLKPGIDKSAHVAKTAKIDQNVEIAAGAKILDYAVIKGPSYIGKDAVVGNGALVRDSMIEANCQVGYGSEVARSYLGKGTKGHMMYVGDSIIEGNVNLSAGTVLANYRFDHQEVMVDLPSGKINSGKTKFGSIIGKGTITGINSSLMPGTVVGSGSTIGSGCVVKGLIPDHTFVKPIYSKVSYEK